MGGRGWAVTGRAHEVLFKEPSHPQCKGETGRGTRPRPSGAHAHVGNGKGSPFSGQTREHQDSELVQGALGARARHAPAGAWGRARLVQLCTQPCDDRGHRPWVQWVREEALTPAGFPNPWGCAQSRRGPGRPTSQPTPSSARRPVPTEKCSLHIRHQQRQGLRPLWLPVSPSAVLCPLSAQTAPCVPDSL